MACSTSCAAASRCASRHLLCVSSGDRLGGEIGDLILLDITIATEFLTVAFLVVLISGSSFYCQLQLFSPLNPTAIAAIGVIALSLSAAIFLISEYVASRSAD
jgi:hypothetical protein